MYFHIETMFILRRNNIGIINKNKINNKIKQKNINII